MSQQEISERVWCGRWFKPAQGVLTLSGDRVLYTAGGTVEFDLPLREIENLYWPWYSFGVAFDATVHGKRYYISFLGTGNTLMSWWRGVRTGREWKVILSNALERSKPV